MLDVESVRLVIWDLDETLWKGTLTEGGITAHIDHHYHVVRELARRGIISAICSKNELAAVKEILLDQGVWDYFVFASVSWEAKGPRIAAIVAAAQLRAATILFIDDNPGNRAEAEAHVPGLQVADETIIGGLLDDPRLRGKNDIKLIRLKQYKLLEQKQGDQAKAGGDNSAFLRSSRIRVELDYDIDQNIDRVIELINRTNQLNFTKLRLPEDRASALRELRREMSGFNRQAALVRVTDTYGDYGYVGFFLLQTTGSSKRLIHFCFSCRTLGMGVERWVYDILQRPRLQQAGEVLTDLNSSDAVDWITLADGVTETEKRAKIPDVRIRGGCELDPLVHYFSLYAERVVSETNFVRKHLFVRKNVTCQLPAAGFDDAEQVAEACKLGFGPDDFRSQLFDPAAEGGSYAIVSFWADRSFNHYKHKRLGYRIACNLMHGHFHDLTAITRDTLEKEFRPNGFQEANRAEIMAYIAEIKKSYEYLGRLRPREAEKTTRQMLDSFPAGVRVFFIVPSVDSFSSGSGRRPQPFARDYNTMIERMKLDYPAVRFVSIEDFVETDNDRNDGADHFDRLVYFRLFSAVLQEILTHQSSANTDGMDAERVSGYAAAGQAVN